MQVSDSKQMTLPTDKWPPDVHICQYRSYLSAAFMKYHFLQVSDLQHVHVSQHRTYLSVVFIKYHFLFLYNHIFEVMIFCLMLLHPTHIYKPSLFLYIKPENRPTHSISTLHFQLLFTHINLKSYKHLH